MDTGDVWMIRYDKLIETSVACPALLAMLHEAMSREIGRDRESLMAVCTLPADARVAEFLRRWADSLAKRGLRSDEITLRMTRAEIGNYLGMTLETVSRAMSRLARDKIIAFAEKGRRDLRIPDVAALSGFVQRCLSPAPRAAVTRWRRRRPRSVDADRARDGLAQLLATAGLAQQLPCRRRVAIGIEQLGGVARHEQDRHLRKPLLRARRQLGAAHPGAQGDVGEQQVEAALPRPGPAAPARRSAPA